MSNLRISGMVSGFDTDKMIQDMMKVENLRVDNVKKERTYSTWQQEEYRNIILKVQSLQSKYFDVLNSKQNLSSPTSFSKFSASVTVAGETSTKVSVTAGSSMKNNTHTINEITQLATKDTWSGEDLNIRGIKTDGFDLAAFKTAMSGKTFQLSLSIGGNAEVIQLSDAEIAGSSTLGDLITTINGKIEAEFGSEYNSVVSDVGGELMFDVVGSNVKIYTYGDNQDTMTSLGFENGVSSLDFKEKSLGDLFNLSDSDLENFEINGVEITLKSSMTIDEAISEINDSDANVNITYESLLDSVRMESEKEGTVNNIDIQTGSSAELFFKKIFNVSDLGLVNREEGLNATLVLDGTAIVQSSNKFTHDGVTYTLNELSADPIDIKIDLNTSEVVDNIKDFVKEYNELIEYINIKVSEKKNYDYEPLTDEERESLSEDEIKKWEEKAKQGILRGSSELSTLVRKLRSTFIDPVDGAGLTMKDIGISTKNYNDKGKLTIDETELKNALEDNFDKVVDLFTKGSDVPYTDYDNRSTRYNENGVGNRILDLLKDYTRLTRDTDGYKGVLVMKAGVEGDISFSSSVLSLEIKEYDKRIESLIDSIADKENSYYKMFARMESALSQMQSQGSSLLSQLGQ
ncbi:flagellar filament capping protein FliD [Fusibacter ferrireducens]|uniref:Flagellar hook-associated protein 2 n=1 Tax=Fusibacter ferrireducens TaxID=2785058 RepID=A0ABR9ZVM6_9FIRM|nr:flagellar filament capping protein FliD [Fusibacter ferrireducens]MBF4694499.1 flagellar filament capping protein FliD [Fusibacter ferrireducens]